MKEENRKYPRQAWMLQPSFKPVEVTVVKRAYTHSYSDWDELSTGKTVHFEALYPSKEAAIAAGREQVEKTQADINKRQENLVKKIVQLNKAEGK